MHNRVFRGSKLHLMRMGNIKCKNNVDFFFSSISLQWDVFFPKQHSYLDAHSMFQVHAITKQKWKSFLVKGHENNTVSNFNNDSTPVWSWLRSKSYKHCSFNSRRRIVFDLRNSRVPSW